MEEFFGGRGIETLAAAIAKARREVGASLRMGSTELIVDSFDVVDALKLAPQTIARRYAIFGVDLTSTAVPRLRSRLLALDGLGWRIMEATQFPGIANHWVLADDSLFGIWPERGEIVEYSPDEMIWEGTIALLWHCAVGPHGLGTLASDLIAVPIAAEIVTALQPANGELLRFLAADPRRLQSLHSRAFERVVADILSADGFDVEITRATRDGGKDLVACLDRGGTRTVVYVECKRNAFSNPVGIEVVQRLYGTMLADNADIGLVVTTSRFTQPAQETATRIGRHRMRLRDFADLKTWLRSHSPPDGASD